MKKKIKLSNLAAANITKLPITLRCPACHRLATLDDLNNVPDHSLQAAGGDAEGRVIVGHRVCPNPSCKLLIYVVYNQRRESNYILAEIIVATPEERIDFDAEGIPASIVNSLEEAITCHSTSCYTAGAIMVRKSLEELCRDKGAEGTRLVDQIKNLANYVIVPPGLIAGVDNLRLLGNDAAHIELKHFDKIDAEEVEVGILFVKELLKAVYQSSQLSDRLEALKKKPSAAT